jgi:hypothetical protein
VLSKIFSRQQEPIQGGKRSQCSVCQHLNTNSSISISTWNESAEAIDQIGLLPCIVKTKSQTYGGDSETSNIGNGLIIEHVLFFLALGM